MRGGAREGSRREAAWAKGQYEPSPIHGGGRRWGLSVRWDRRGQEKTGFSVWLRKRVWPCGQMEALGYGGEACQQTRSISCLQTGRGPILRWAGNRNQWGVVSITLSLCGFCIVKWRSLLCQWSRELVMCLRAVFSFMFPLVILDGTHPSDATLQTHLGHPSARSQCSGCDHFAQLCG